MKQKIQTVIPAGPAEMVCDKTASQDHSCLENTADGSRDHFSEDQAGAVHGRHQDLNGPVALLTGDGGCDHLPVKDHQEVQDKNENIRIPVIAGSVFSQDLHRGDAALVQDFLYF